MAASIPYFISLGLIGLAVAWVPLWLERVPLSLPMVAVVAGGSVFGLFEDQVRIAAYRGVGETLTEIALIVSVMGAGLRIDRRFGGRAWGSTWRLLGFVMPLSIVAITGLSEWLFGLPFGPALVLAGMLAPTDPVLAASVQVGPPGTGDRGEAHFALTSEAGLNDGLAFPFVALGLAVTLHGGHLGGWIFDWVLTEVVWQVVAAAVLGAAVGTALFRINVGLPSRLRIARSRDGLVSVAVTFLVYGLAEAIHSYGFVAVFAAAVALRNTSGAIDYHVQMVEFADQIERFAAAMVLLLFGGAIAQGVLAGLGWPHVVFAMAVLLVVRPVATLASFAGSGTTRAARAAIAYFGIRGLGSLYYLAYVANHAGAALTVIEPAVAFTVLCSVVLYGMTTNVVLGMLKPRQVSP